MVKARGSWGSRSRNSSLARVIDLDVYDAVKNALTSMTSDEAMDYMEKLLTRRGGKETTKILVVDALGERDDERSAELLGAALRNQGDEVARAAIQAVHKRRLVSAVEPMIEQVA